MSRFFAMNSAIYARIVYVLLGFALIGRFWMAQTFELTPQEAYFWLLGVGQNADWGYYDSGVFLPWFIKVGTFFFSHTELGVRWLTAVVYAATGFFIFLASRHWFNAKAALWSVILYLVIPLYTWDLLLMNEATCALGLMMLILISYRQAVLTLEGYWWVFAGIISGVALHVSWFTFIWPMSLLLYLSGIWIVRLKSGVPEERLVPIQQALKKFWIIVFFLFVAVIPIVAWYYRPETQGLRRLHHIPFFRETYVFSWSEGGAFLSQQIWHLSPGIFFAMLIAFLVAGKTTFTHRRYALLMALCLPGFFVQLVACFFGAAEPELMPAFYLPALFLAGNFGVGFAQKSMVWKVFGLGVILLALGQTVAGLIPSINRSWQLGSGLYYPHSYRRLAQDIRQAMEETGASIVIADQAELASVITFYTPDHQLVYVEDGPNIRSQFDFWPSYGDFYGYSAIFVASQERVLPQIKKEFRKVTPVKGSETPWKLYYCDQLVSGETSEESLSLEPVNEPFDVPDRLPEKEELLPENEMDR